ncbi:MAG TPA: GldG family protein, partial [Myxococcota bacterium]|nr:GldG family protein [Myxococcota bacterium]
MSKLGRILGICGLVALLSVPLTLFLWDWQLTWVAVAKLAFGLAALAAWFLSARPRLGQTFRARPAFYGTFAGLFSALAVVGLVVVNFLAQAHPLRWDLTRERIFSLSAQTLDVLAGLQDTLEVRAFFGPQEPETESVRGWLERYRLASPRFAYELVDPVVRLEAVEKHKIVPGGPRVLLTYRGREERVRLGQVDASGPEEVLTGALMRLTQAGGERVLCFTSGHGERSLTGEDPRLSMSLWARDLEGEGFRTQALSLLEAREVPAACLALVVAGPAQDLAPDELQAIAAYLDRGGRLLALVGYGDSASLNALLAKRGALVTGRAVIFPEGRSPLEVVTDPQQYPSAHPIFARFFQGGSVSLGQLQAVLPMARQLSVHKAEGALPMLVL